MATSIFLQRNEDYVPQTDYLNPTSIASTDFTTVQTEATQIVRPQNFDLSDLWGSLGNLSESTWDSAANAASYVYEGAKDAVVSAKDFALDVGTGIVDNAKSVASGFIWSGLQIGLVVVGALLVVVYVIGKSGIVGQGASAYATFATGGLR